MDVKRNQINLINLKQLYKEFMELKLSKNNAKEAIELASKFVDVGCFRKNYTRDERKEVFIKLKEAFNMIGDRANADKYADKIKIIDEINKVLLPFKDFKDLKLPENNTANANKAIELASKFVENQCFIEKCPEKNKNDVYAKLATAYYLKGDYENAYKYLCKNTGIYYLDEGRNYEYQSQVCIFDDEFDWYLKDRQQRKKLEEICYDVYYKLGYLSEAEYGQYIDPLEECYVRKLLKEDFSKMCYIEFEWVLERFEKIDLSKKNEKDAEEVIEIASKFMNIPIFNERYNKLPMSDIYGKLGEAYYIIGEYEYAIANLLNSGRLEEGGKFKELYDKCRDELLKIKNKSMYEASKEMDKRTKYLSLKP